MPTQATHLFLLEDLEDGGGEAGAKRPGTAYELPERPRFNQWALAGEPKGEETS